MTSKRINAIESLDLEQLADRIEELISICEILREENRNLRIRLANAEANQQRLLENGEQTRRRIETMISRLKVLEAEL
jgi:cell division protein ZapB